MSTRTIIEINHDCLTDLMNSPTQIAMFLRMLGLTQETAKPYAPQGMRILGQRHHSETLNLTVE